VQAAAIHGSYTQQVSHLLCDCNLLCSCLELCKWCAGSQHAALHPPLQQLAAAVCIHCMLPTFLCLLGPILFIHPALLNAERKENTGQGKLQQQFRALCFDDRPSLESMLCRFMGQITTIHLHSRPAKTCTAHSESCSSLQPQQRPRNRLRRHTKRHNTHPFPHKDQLQTERASQLCCSLAHPARKALTLQTRLHGQLQPHTTPAPSPVLIHV
jgi:hypothetical protein